MQMYFMAIVLPPQLNERILLYKQMMLEQYHCRVGLKSPAHITIIPPFWMHPDKQPDLLQLLDHHCNGYNKFPVTTNHFSAFKPRTIFIDVVVDQQLKAFKHATDAYFTGENIYGIKTEKRPFHPHITIATRDLSKTAFAEAWKHFEALQFEETFEATGLATLRHNQKNWDVIHTSQFKNI